MRRGTDNRPGALWLYDTDLSEAEENGKTTEEFESVRGELVGFYLSWDHCAEHEWGTKGLRQILGIRTAEDDVHGLPRYAIRNPKNVIFVEEGSFALLRSASHRFDDRVKEAGSLRKWINSNRELSIGNEDKFNKGFWRPWAAAWSERDFGIAVKGKDNVKRLRTLYEAIQRGDGSLWMGGGGGPFSNAGMIIAITSMVPKNTADGMEATHLDAKKLKAAIDKTGVLDRLKEHQEKNPWPSPDKCGYFACRGHWATEKDKGRTKHPVTFFLNPEGQDKNNFGWFTVEDLDAWMKGEGPIPKKEEVK